MSQRGSSQNFLFKYAPLRLRGVNNQPTINPRANMSGSQVPSLPRLSRLPTNPSIDETTTTVFEVNNSGPCDLLNSSLDNITNFCQRQELRNRDIQVQLELATAEIGTLKARLDTSAREIEQLQHINQKLRNSHQHVEKELQKVDQLYAEVKNIFADTAQIIEDTRKEKETWLSNFETLQKINYERKEMQLRNEFKRSIDEKDAKIDAMRCEAEQLIIQFQDTSELRTEIANSIEHIKQLNSINDTKEKELNVIRDKLASMQQAVSTYEDVKHSLNILSKDRAALQDRYSLLEKKYNMTSEALVDCTSHKDGLEITLDGLNKELQEERKNKYQAISETQELIQQLTTCQKILDEKTTKVDDLAKELAVFVERYRDLEKKAHELEKIVVGHDDSLRVIADLEKEIDELKCHLATKSTEIQSKEKKLEETEYLLSDLKLQSLNVDKLAMFEEKNHELQLELKKKEAELEAALSCQHESQRLKTDSDKEIAELKCQLTAKSIELQYKEKRLEELEKTVDEVTLKSLNPSQAESGRVEVDLLKQKAKNEIETLKTALNLKSLELENVNDEYEEAQKMMASAERKIADLELTVSILERKLETEREQASFTPQPYGVPDDVELRALRPILKQSSSSVYTDHASQNSGESTTGTTDNKETLNLLQKANAFAKAAELKRRDSGSNACLIKIPPSPSSSWLNPTEKRRKLDKSDGRASSIKMDLRDCVTESPVLRCQSDGSTSRFLARSNASSVLHSMEPIEVEDSDGNDNEIV
ncbi:probable DNA double-strand break repair Rad50 ATPase [Daphnia carinata]|uniref:probable DNA double-strand break repair Rad50 ATPase n=1 Tax=Daphnia carinata TaxID=120202 RepID=UPI00257C4893|nr:probable DNA double-strand break repair Rad50 ATPase [Daphnia carinata]